MRSQRSAPARPHATTMLPFTLHKHQDGRGMYLATRCGTVELHPVEEGQLDETWRPASPACPRSTCTAALAAPASTSPPDGAGSSSSCTRRITAPGARSSRRAKPGSTRTG